VGDNLAKPENDCELRRGCHKKEPQAAYALGVTQFVASLGF
jgi:hypothetical protein